jgi:protease I
VLAVVSNHGVEQDDLVIPMARLRSDGVTVDVAAQRDDDVLTLIGDWDAGRRVSPTATIAGVDIAGYDLLLLPGGVVNADALRLDAEAVAIAKDFIRAGQPVAAICDAPWLLVEAGVIAGKRLTSFPSLRSDLVNAGGEWVDEPVVVDDALGWSLITSRDPDDLDAFIDAVEAVLATLPDAVPV